MKIHYLLLGVLGLSLCGLTSCSSEDTPAIKTDTDTPTVTLSIACVENGSISRAQSPLHEPGDVNERAISKASIIIYDEPINSGRGTVMKVINLTNLGDPVLQNINSQTNKENIYYYTGQGASTTAVPISYNNIIANKYTIRESNELARQLMGLGLNNTFYAVAVANMTLPSTVKAGMPVSALRDVIYNGALYNEDGQTTITNKDADGQPVLYKDFAMSGINEIKFTVAFDQNDHLQLDPLMVQRLAARIDVAFGVQATIYDPHWEALPDPETGDKPVPGIEDYETVNGNTVFLYDVDVTGDGKYYRFPIYSEEEYRKGNLVRMEGMIFWLKNIKLLNCNNQGCYLFEQSSGTPKYLGNEGSWVQADGATNTYAQNLIYSYKDRVIADRQLTSSTKSPVSVIEGGLKTPNLRFNLLPTTGGDEKWGVYSILGYVGENTFEPVGEGQEDNNKYTGIYIEGVTNLGTAFTDNGTSEDEEDTDENRSVMSTSLYLRHSFGSDLESTGNMHFGIVRNTIYRVYFKFFASGNVVLVRYYYYKGSDGSFNENIYPSETSPLKFVANVNVDNGSHTIKD